MQLWNAYIITVNRREIVTADCNIDKLLDGFVRQYGRQMHAENLRRNFILHLNNLYDHGILSPTSMYRVIMAFDEVAMNPDS